MGLFFTTKVGIIASSHSLIEPEIVMHWVEHFHLRKSFFVELICVILTYTPG